METGTFSREEGGAAIRFALTAEDNSGWKKEPVDSRLVESLQRPPIMYAHQQRIPPVLPLAARRVARSARAATSAAPDAEGAGRFAKRRVSTCPARQPGGSPWVGLYSQAMGLASQS